MTDKKPTHKGVILLENQLRAISYLADCYEKYLLLRESELEYSGQEKMIHGYFKRAMFDNACLIIKALFGSNDENGKKIRDNINYLNLLQEKGGLGKKIEKQIVDELGLLELPPNIDDKEQLLKRILERRSEKEIKQEYIENLLRYRDKIFCHQDDYNPKDEEIYFPVLYDFVKNAMELFGFIVDLYSTHKNAPNFDWTDKYWSEENIAAKKAKFKIIEDAYTCSSKHKISPQDEIRNKNFEPYDERSRLLARQCDIIMDIIYYYPMYCVLRNLENKTLDFSGYTLDKDPLIGNGSFLYAVYSSLLLKIWILFGEEDAQNTHTHYNNLLRELNKFCLQLQKLEVDDSFINRKQTCLEKIQKKNSELDHFAINQLICEITTKLKDYRRSVAHANFEFELDESLYSSQSLLIKETVQALCKLWPLVAMFRVYSHEHIDENAHLSGGNGEIVFDKACKDFEISFMAIIFSESITVQPENL